MASRIIADARQIELTFNRLCYQLIENHGDFSHTVLAGIQPRGVPFADRLVKHLRTLVKPPISYGTIDPTFHRDDYRHSPTHLLPNEMHMPFLIENKKVVLIDDVLYSGRTIRAAMDTLLDFGRPSRVELMVLVNRRYTREVPLQAEVKEFSTGSLGWYLNGKTTIDVGGTPVSVQIGMNLTIVGSKELPQDHQPAAAADAGA